MNPLYLDRRVTYKQGNYAYFLTPQGEIRFKDMWNDPEIRLIDMSAEFGIQAKTIRRIARREELGEKARKWDGAKKELPPKRPEPPPMPYGMIEQWPDGVWFEDVPGLGSLPFSFRRAVKTGKMGYYK